MSIKIKLTGTARTDVGLKRTNNEDSFYVNQDIGFFLVADGMGGAAKGEVASQIVAGSMADYLVRYINQPIEDVDRFDFYDSEQSDRANTLLQSVHLANRLVFETAQNKKGHQGMGSTVAALLSDDQHVLILNVGDSRVYRARDFKFTRLTADHRLADDPKMKTVINMESTIINEMGNILTRAMGIKEQLDPDLQRIPVVEGDTFLLCSDGLSDYVQEEMIASVMQMERSAEQKVNDLVELALAGGGRDNITVIMVQAQPASRLKGFFQKITKAN